MSRVEISRVDFDCVNDDVWTALRASTRSCTIYSDDLTSLGIFFNLVNFACIAKGIGKRGKRAKRDIVRASVVLFMRSFSHEGVFSDSGRWAAFLLALFLPA